MKKSNGFFGMAVAISALLPALEAQANGIPPECLIPSKVAPKVCQELPAEVCLDYFKARIQNNRLASAKSDQTTNEADFCLRQFRDQLFVEEE